MAITFECKHENIKGNLEINKDLVVFKTNEKSLEIQLKKVAICALSDLSILLHMEYDEETTENCQLDSESYQFYFETQEICNKAHEIINQYVVDTFSYSQTQSEFSNDYSYENQIFQSPKSDQYYEQQ